MSKRWNKINLDVFPVVLARVLIAGSEGAFTIKALSMSIADRFKKQYRHRELREHVDTLIQKGFMERLDSRDKFLITHDGWDFKNYLERLARRYPHPYQRFVRPSYSPNIADAIQCFASHKTRGDIQPTPLPEAALA